MNAILVHAQATGTALASPITDVQIGLPVPRGRCGRVYWDGEAQPVRMGGRRDLSGELVSQKITVTWFWPLAETGEVQAKARVLEMATVVDDLRRRVLADSQLGGSSTDLEMGYAQPDFLQLGGATYAIVVCEFTTDYVEYPIAP